MAELLIAIHNGETLSFMDVTESTTESLSLLTPWLQQEELDVVYHAVEIGMTAGEATMKLFSTITMERAREILRNF